MIGPHHAGSNDQCGLIEAACLVDSTVRERMVAEVLEPVARMLLSEDELEFLALTTSVDRDGITWLFGSITACGEVWEAYLWHPHIGYDSIATLCAVIEDSLIDWISETRFGWGQLRHPG